MPANFHANRYILTGVLKKASMRSTAAYQMPGDVLICSGKKTTSKTAAEFESIPH